MKDQRQLELYRKLKEIVDPKHTALVAWDVQNALVNSAFNKDAFLNNLEIFMDTARKNNIPIIYSKILRLPIKFESSWRIYMLMKRLGVDDPTNLPEFMQPGSLDAEIHSQLIPKEDDFIIERDTGSIFMSTHFEYMMRNRGINTILFTGIATEIGIDSSARDCSNRGFYTIVVQDCVSSSDKEMHESALKTLARVCLVISSKEILRKWK